ncbi:protein kinase domain-containing protein, partial [Singulisphaera rosea]
RSAGLFFTVVLALTLGRDFVLGEVVAWQLQIAAILAVATIVAILSAPRPIKTRRLRILEILIFGIAAGILALRHYHAMLMWASRGDEVAIATAAKNMIISSVLLMFAYAMLIPGTWRRALRFAVTFAVLPEVTTAVVLLVHPTLFPAIRDVATFDRMSRDFVLLLIAGGLSVYGTHVLNSLRREVFEARRLNQYRLGKKIGAGGMGEVYLAEHQLLKRPCAVKLIRPDKAGDARELARFEREVRATARLSHPNTVDVYDFG